MTLTSLRLRDLPTAGRLSLTFLMFVLLGGYAASLLHMREHHQNRDEVEGLSLTDLQGAYHGVTNVSPLITALRNGHPGELEGVTAPDAAIRATLLGWLEGDANLILPNWDNLDLGDDVPADLLDMSCVGCHSRTAAEDLRAEPPLQFLDDIRAVAFSREISPADIKILLASTHTHALALGVLTLVLCLLMYATAASERKKGLLCLLASGGLLVDLAAWWAARMAMSFVPLIVAGGVAHAIGVVLIILAVLVELWRPATSA